jgi:hypothetical protein
MNAPKRACQFVLDLQADTRQELADSLYNIASRIERGEMTRGVSGGYSSGYVYELTENEGPTHDEWAANLRAYLDAKKDAASGVKGRPASQSMDPQRERELADPSHAAFEEAMRQTWQMVDPIRPAGQPGSYNRGEHNGVIAALRTVRDNYERERRTLGVKACQYCGGFTHIGSHGAGHCIDFDRMPINAAGVGEVGRG